MQPASHVSTGADTPQTLSPQQRATKQAAAYIRIPWALVQTIRDLCATTAAEVYLTLHGLAERYPYSADYLATRMSRDSIAAHCGISLSTLDRVLAELEGQGLISRYQTRHPYLPHRQGWSIIHVRIPEAAWAAMEADSYIGGETQSNGQSASPTPNHRGPAASNDPAPTTPCSSAAARELPPASAGQGRAPAAPTVPPAPVADAAAAPITPRDIQRYWASSNDAGAYQCTDTDSVRRVCQTVAAALADGVPPDRADLSRCIQRALRPIRDQLPPQATTGSLPISLADQILHSPVHSGATSTQPAATVDADTLRLLRAKLSPAEPDSSTRQQVEAWVQEGAWALCHTFSKSSRAKAINAISKLIRSGTWGTPWGFDARCVQPTSDGGLAFTA